MKIRAEEYSHHDTYATSRCTSKGDLPRDSRAKKLLDETALDINMPVAAYINCAQHHQPLLSISRTWIPLK